MYMCHRFFILNVKTFLHDVANTCNIEQYIWTDYWSIVILVLNVILTCEA